MESRNRDGYTVSRHDLMELFQQDNRRLAKTEPSRSVSVLEKRLGWREGLLTALKTDPVNGISKEPSSVEARLSKFGSNARREVKIKSLWTLVKEQFGDTILQVLLVAAAVSLVIGILREGFEKGWLEGTTIYLAVVIIVSVAAGNDYVKEKQF